MRISFVVLLWGLAVGGGWASVTSAANDPIAEKIE
jgi:hypothetical protein